MMAQAKTKGVRHAGRRDSRTEVDQAEGGAAQTPRGEDPPREARQGTDCPGEQERRGGWHNGKGFDFRKTQHSAIKPDLASGQP